VAARPTDPMTPRRHPRVLRRRPGSRVGTRSAPGRAPRRRRPGAASRSPGRRAAPPEGHQARARGTPGRMTPAGSGRRPRWLRRPL